MVDVGLPVWVGSVMESSASRVVVSRGLPGALVKIQALTQHVAQHLHPCELPGGADAVEPRTELQGHSSKTVHKWVLRGQGCEWVWRWDGTLHCEYISSVEIPGQNVHTGPSDT